MSVVAPSFAMECYEREAWKRMDSHWDDWLELCVIVLLTWSVEQLAWEEASSTVSARFQRSEGKAMRSLLDATCDAV
eukprot:CAMPEP_0195083486 /NCGR_PEP_ID=MMETSP0448-20130528/24420_1 /TAXON_ID=66468 /ORGANISM="Heterocapsa triquestra, Strain CCMP 448" /LENGTH=76 /DNA_ID=CAMNT_0040116701 /DNA_START=55 /DNA_END=281 /DNA_ORIENTATION=+